MEPLSRKGLIRQWTKKMNVMGVYNHFGNGNGVVFEIQQVLRFSRSRDTVERLFQLQPTMKGIFHIDGTMVDKDGEMTGILEMLQIVAAILGLDSGDVILLSKDHDIVLRRSRGKLLLNSAWGFWNPSRSSQIHFPYEMQQLQPPLDM
jgi:hypothetical protein